MIKVSNTYGTGFTRSLYDAGLRHLRLLRHSVATMAIEAGVDLKTVSSLPGHSTTSTTADVYAHVTDALGRERQIGLMNWLRGRFGRQRAHHRSAENDSRS
jgi:integrase